jgi:hypothetical protein
MEKKAQSAVEFIILLGVMLFIFLAYTQVFQKNLAEKSKEQRVFLIQDLALTVQNEIDLASSSTSGYERTFKVPEKILNIEYSISLVDNSVYVITNDNKIATSLPIQNVTGEIQKGDNFIKKNESGVYINT